MKIAIDDNHKVIPKPEPGIACGKELKEDKLSNLQMLVLIQQKRTNHDNTRNEEQPKKDSMFMNPEAISRAPICNGINKLLNVPLKTSSKVQRIP